MRLIIKLFVLVSLVDGKLTGSYRPQGEDGKLTGSYRPQGDRHLVEETKSCIQFDDPQVDNALGSEDKDASPECDNNDCSGGCCRFHTMMLVCDEKDEFPHQPVSVEMMVFKVFSSQSRVWKTHRLLHHRKLPLKVHLQ
jgi:hypothetical protein